MVVSSLEDIMNCLNGFTGYFKDKNIKDKHRLNLPPKYKSFFEESSWKAIGGYVEDDIKLPHIVVSTPKLYVEYVKEKELHIGDVASTLKEWDIDKNGRITLSKGCVDYIELENDCLVTLIGRGHHFRIYSNENGEKAWENIQERVNFMMNKEFSNYHKYVK